MKLAMSSVSCIALITFASGVRPASAQSGVTERMSVDSNGAEANNNNSDMPAISADGRFVAFASIASNLVPDDTNDFIDTFVHDRRTGTTERVSVDSRGRQGDGHSGLVGVAGHPAISADGRFVAFPSEATNLVHGDTNGTTDVFVRDRLLGITERVTVSSTGEQSDGFSDGHGISADGRFVAFHSDAFNLVPKQNTFQFIDQVFVHDRVTRTTEIVSVNNSGVEGNSASFRADISADGHFVVFSSFADNLVPGTQFFHQVFLRR
jgi:Tol biopolymer transport system component